MTFLGRTFTAADARRVAWTAIQAGVAVFSAASVTDVKSAKVVALSAITAAGAAALSAVKNWLLADASPAK